MSNLKYKSSLNKPSSNSTALSSNQPIWCSLTTPSQIARKYASIAPIWTHISRKNTFITNLKLLYYIKN